MRRISKDAIFTLSHVHCPVPHAPKFERAAKWILPYCRLNETANGQVFEHLHSSLANPNAGTAFGRKHAYIPSRCGFSARNATGRGEVISEGTDVLEYMWFEEWRDWTGVEMHGETAYGRCAHIYLRNVSSWLHLLVNVSGGSHALEQYSALVSTLALILRRQKISLSTWRIYWRRVDVLSSPIPRLTR